jgi:hypothetical protein
MTEHDKKDKMNTMRINQKAKVDSHFYETLSYETLSLYTFLWGGDRASEMVHRPYKKQSPSKQLRNKRKAERIARRRNRK